MAKEQNKMKLLTAVEREMHHVFTMSKENAVDTVMLWVRRNKVGVDEAVLSKIIDLFRTGISDAWMSHIDSANKRLITQVDPLIRDDEDPLS